jgi:hypothetical protein
MALAPTERRVKKVFVGERDVLELFFAATRDGPEYLYLPRLSLPDGALLLACHHDFSSRAFWFIAHHPSFPEVPDGEMTPPADPAGVWVERVRFRRETDPDDPVPVYVPAGD